MMIKIKKLTKHDAEHYRSIRLEALFNNPDSFGTMYDEEAVMQLSFCPLPLCVAVSFRAALCPRSTIVWFSNIWNRENGI